MTDDEAKAPRCEARTSTGEQCTLSTSHPHTTHQAVTSSGAHVDWTMYDRVLSLDEQKQIWAYLRHRYGMEEEP